MVVDVMFDLLQLFEGDAPGTFHFRLPLTDFPVWFRT